MNFVYSVVIFRVNRDKTIDNKLMLSAAAGWTTFTHNNIIKRIYIYRDKSVWHLLRNPNCCLKICDLQIV